MLSLATLRPKKPSVQPPDPNIRSGFRETAGKAASPNCSNNQTLRGTTRGVLLEILGDVPAMSPIGPSRRFAAAQQFSRFRSEADIEPDL